MCVFCEHDEESSCIISSLCHVFSLTTLLQCRLDIALVAGIVVLDSSMFIKRKLSLNQMYMK